MNSTSNIALKVPFNEKDHAKSLGARWNAEAKHWYVPQGVNSAPFEKWFTNTLTLSNVQSTPKTTIKTEIKTISNNQSIIEDIDAINARLRDAYEVYDSNEF